MDTSVIMLNIGEDTMSKKMKMVASYHLMRGDLSSLAAYSADSARVLGKRGADKLIYASGEVRYFLLATDYHAANLEEWLKCISETDKKAIQNASKGKDVFYSESWRLDVMAAVFEFDAELVCVRTIFDRLVRVLETPLSSELPISIKDFVKRTDGEMRNPLSKQLKKAWEDWGVKAKDYRDCFLHYWTFHTDLERFFSKTGRNRELIIPDNPEERSRDKFRYKKQIKLVNYARDINKRCVELTESIFEQIFERLVAEEFGNSATFTYWDEDPEVDVKQIKGAHKLLISPGLVCDASGKKIRVPRYVKLENGRVYIDDIVLSKALLNTLQCPIELEDNPILPIEITGSIHKMPIK